MVSTKTLLLKHYYRRQGNVAKNPVEKNASNPVTSVAVMVSSALTQRDSAGMDTLKTEIKLTKFGRGDWRGFSSEKKTERLFVNLIVRHVKG